MKSDKVSSWNGLFRPEPVEILPYDGPELPDVSELYSLPSLKFRNMSWMDKGACRTAAVSLDFFDLGYHNRIKLEKVCATCPVKDECLEFAMRNKEAGWWGGTSESERSKMMAKS